MKILYICGDMGVEISGRKGASTHVRETCHALMRYGHEVLLVTPCPGDYLQLRMPIMQVNPPTSKKLGQDLRYMLLNVRMRKLIRRAINEFRPDGMYERYALYQSAGVELARELGIPRIAEINTLLAKEQASRLHWPGLAQKVERSIWAREQAIVVVSQRLKEMVTAAANLKPEKMAGFVISPVAVDPEVFHPSVKPVSKDSIGVHDKMLAAYIGTLTAWHGVELFFEAAGIIKRKGYPVVILAVGGEPEKVNQLRGRAAELGVQEQLIFHGSIRYQEVPSYIAAADMCLIADTQDWSSPTKFFEFAAMRKPIVASRSPAVQEVFGNVGGFFFERGSAEGMVQQIMKVLNDPTNALHVSEQARNRVLSNYTWACNVGSIMNLYGKLGVSGLTSPDNEVLRQESMV